MIPDAAVKAAGEALQRYMVGDDLERVPTPVTLDAADGWVAAIDNATETAMPAVLAAALPHLIDDEMVERAAGALWDHREREERRWHSYVDPGDLRDLRDPRAEARAVLEAALVRDD